MLGYLHIGTDCPPLLANLIRLNTFQKLLDIYIHVDDLLTLNTPSFEAEISNIYPRELVLKKTTESSSMVSHLDISITISENNYYLRQER